MDDNLTVDCSEFFRTINRDLRRGVHPTLAAALMSMLVEREIKGHDGESFTIQRFVDAANDAFWTAEDYKTSNNDDYWMMIGRGNGFLDAIRLLRLTGGLK